MLQYELCEKSKNVRNSCSSSRGMDARLFIVQMQKHKYVFFAFISASHALFRTLKKLGASFEACAYLIKLVH